MTSKDPRLFDSQKYYLKHIVHGKILVPPYQENEYSNACEYKINSNGRVIDVIAFDNQCTQVMARRKEMKMDVSVAVKGLMGIDKGNDNLIVQSGVSIIK